MTEASRQSDHPVDELPRFVRGQSAVASAIERHLAVCESCRSEVDVLRALAGSAPTPLSAVERERVRRAVDARRASGRRLESGGSSHGAGGSRGTGSHPWLSWTWRAAAGIALILMSVGVLRVVQEGATPDWDPGLALDGWGQEVADLELEAGEVRLALGAGLLDDPTLDFPLEEAAAELEGLALPWEEGDR